MPFMKKEEMLAAAERLGVELSGLSWSEQQKAVQQAIAESDFFSDSQSLAQEPEKKQSENSDSNRNDSLAQRMADSIKGSKPILLNEQYNPVRHQLIKYSEYLGEDLQTRDVSYVNTGIPQGDNEGAMLGGYVIQGKTGRKVFGLSSIPKYNVRIYFDPEKHWYAPIVVDFDGREGYVWQHPQWVGIKPLLIDTGYYDDYADQLDSVKHPRNIWLAGSKIWAVSIPLVERIFRDIEKKAERDGR